MRTGLVATAFIAALA
jgi:pimeloyl-ACP methyl ester carboxylesterase